MENKGTIDELSYTEKGDKGFYKLKISGKSFTAFDNADAFTQLKNKEFHQGETVGYDHTEKQGDFNGKPVTYRNLVKLIKVAQPLSTDSKELLKDPVIQKIAKEVDWEAKDRRIVRMAALNTAVELVKTNFVALPEEVQKGGVNANVVINIAKQFEDWVYREEPKEVEE